MEFMHSRLCSAFGPRKPQVSSRDRVKRSLILSSVATTVIQQAFTIRKPQNRVCGKGHEGISPKANAFNEV
jgi:hypothetical protein